MRLVFRILGYIVATIGIELDPEEFEEEPAGITGGPTLHMERDLDPPNPSGEEPYWEDRGFGFR